MAATVSHAWPDHSRPVFPRLALPRPVLSLPFAGHPAHPGPVSPLMLADRLITLAQDADRAGYRETASHLVGLVYTVLDPHAVS